MGKCTFPGKFQERVYITNLVLFYHKTVVLITKMVNCPLHIFNIKHFTRLIFTYNGFLKTVDVPKSCNSP